MNQETYYKRSLINDYNDFNQNFDDDPNSVFGVFDEILSSFKYSNIENLELINCIFNFEDEIKVNRLSLINCSGKTLSIKEGIFIFLFNCNFENIKIEASNIKVKQMDIFNFECYSEECNFLLVKTNKMKDIKIISKKIEINETNINFNIINFVDYIKFFGCDFLNSSHIFNCKTLFIEGCYGTSNIDFRDLYDIRKLKIKYDDEIKDLSKITPFIEYLSLNLSDVEKIPKFHLNMKKIKFLYSPIRNIEIEYPKLEDLKIVFCDNLEILDFSKCNLCKNKNYENNTSLKVVKSN